MGIRSTLALILLVHGFGHSSAQCSTATPWLVIYQGGLANNFIDESWNTPDTICSTDVTQSGNAVISAAFGSYSGVQLSHSPAFPISGYSSLDFWINGGPQGNQQILVGISGYPSGSTSSRNYVVSMSSYLPNGLPANTWEHITIPLSDFKATGASLISVFFQDPSGKGQPLVYLNNIQLLGQGGCNCTSPALSALSLPPQCSATIPWLVIYQDGLANNFIDGSWNSPHNLCDATVVQSGVTAISATLGSYSGVQLSHSPAFPISGYSSLDFWINGGPQGNQQILVGISGYPSNSASSKNYVVSIGSYLSNGLPANTWEYVTIPLSDFKATGVSLISVFFQDPSGKGQPLIYLDSIQLLGQSGCGCSSNSPTPPLTPLSTRSPTPALPPSPAPSSPLPTPLSPSPTPLSPSPLSPSPTPLSPLPTPLSTPRPISSSSRESWTWMYQSQYSDSWKTSLAAIISNKNSFTYVSPLFYTVNYNYMSGVAYYSSCGATCTAQGTNSFSGMTVQQITQQLTSAGLAVVPGIYGGASNQGVDTGIQNILNNPTTAGASFISAMVQEAKSNGYAGYNIDWEPGSGVDNTYADKFISFVNAFKTALGSLSLSVDVITSNIEGTYCSSNNGYLDFGKLSKSLIDRVIIEDYFSVLGTASTSCQPVTLSSTHPVSCPQDSNGNPTVVGIFDYMCYNLPASMIVIGLEACSTSVSTCNSPCDACYGYGTNPIAGQVMSVIKNYGFSKIAVWPQAESNSEFLSTQKLVASQSDWYSILAQFLTALS